MSGAKAAQTTKPPAIWHQHTAASNARAAEAADTGPVLQVEFHRYSYKLSSILTGVVELVPEINVARANPVRRVSSLGLACIEQT